MLFALGAVFFALGFRFFMLRWREHDFAEKRLHAAIEQAERELTRGVNAVRSPVVNHELARQAREQDEHRVVQARSDPPGPLA